MTGGVTTSNPAGAGETGKDSETENLASDLTVSGENSERKFVIGVEYDGTNYHGFQLQAGANTIQAELEKAILALTGENRRVIPASRTDAGVHAVEQMVAFRTTAGFTAEVIIKALNYHLPKDIAVTRAYRVRSTIDVRRDAIGREYKYYMLNREVRSPLNDRYTYVIGGEIDIAAMNEACGLLLGEHDFLCFASALDASHLGKTRRTVFHAAVVRGPGNMVIFEVAANSFLTHQVRNTVGTLLQIGRHRLGLSEVLKLLEAKRAGMAGPGVPARGLFLVKINYPYSFEEVAE